VITVGAYLSLQGQLSESSNSLNILIILSFMLIEFIIIYLMLKLRMQRAVCASDHPLHGLQYMNILYRLSLKITGFIKKN
jgi:hypothetical protein